MFSILGYVFSKKKQYHSLAPLTYENRPLLTYKNREWYCLKYSH